MEHIKSTSKTLKHKVSKNKTGHIVVTSTIESIYRKEDIEGRIFVLNIHKQKAEEALDAINREINELEEIIEQMESDQV